MGKIGHDKAVVGTGVEKQLAEFIIRYGKHRKWKKSQVLQEVLTMWFNGDTAIDKYDEDLKNETAREMGIDRKKPKKPK